MMLPWLVLAIVNAERPVVPTKLDSAQPTCIALGAPDADALYLVPRQECDSRVCRLIVELQTVSANTAPRDPLVIVEGDPLAAATLWNEAARTRVQEVASRFSLPCRTTPLSGPLTAGARRYTLALRDDVWWARSDNGREQALRKVGYGKGDLAVVDGHPAFHSWAFARGTDTEGRLVLQALPLTRVAAPAFTEIIAAPQPAGVGLTCLGWDRDEPAMLLESRRKTCGEGAKCNEEAWLVRVTARGSEDLMRLPGTNGAADAARSYLGDLDLGCTDGSLDEPTYDGRTLMVAPALSETSIDVSVFEPREKHWNVGPLRTVKTHNGTQREDVAAVLWHPDVPIIVLRVMPPAGEGERFVWVDLAARRIASQR